MSASTCHRPSAATKRKYSKNGAKATASKVMRRQRNPSLRNSGITSADLFRFHQATITCQRGVESLHPTPLDLSSPEASVMNRTMFLPTHGFFPFLPATGHLLPKHSELYFRPMTFHALSWRQGSHIFRHGTHISASIPRTFPPPHNLLFR